MSRRSRSDEAALITTAHESGDDEYDRRRRKYAIMMSLRALAVLGAALTYRVSLWLALAFIVAGMVLPWCAVIMANDRPVKKPQKRVVIVGETVPGGVHGLVARVSHGEGGDHVATQFTTRQPNNLAPPPPTPRPKMSVSLNPPNALGFRRTLLAISSCFSAYTDYRTPYNPRQTFSHHHKPFPLLSPSCVSPNS